MRTAERNGKSYYTAEEVMMLTGCSKRKAYYLISKLNREWEAKGGIFITGKVNKQYFDSKGYAPTYLKTLNNQLSAIFNYATRYYNLKNNACKIAGSMGKSQGEKMELYTRQ